MPKRLPLNPHLIRALRERKGMTQEALADACHAADNPVEPRTIQRFEKGGRGDVQKIEAIARALGCHPQDLLDPIHGQLGAFANQHPPLHLTRWTAKETSSLIWQSVFRASSVLSINQRPDSFFIRTPSVYDHYWAGFCPPILDPASAEFRQWRAWADNARGTQHRVEREARRVHFSGFSPSEQLLAAPRHVLEDTISDWQTLGDNRAITLIDPDPWSSLRKAITTDIVDPLVPVPDFLHWNRLLIVDDDLLVVRSECSFSFAVLTGNRQRIASLRNQVEHLLATHGFAEPPKTKHTVGRLIAHIGREN